MKKNNITEELEMDMTTYKKVKGTLDPKTPIKITGDKPTDTSNTTSSSTSSMVEEGDDNIEPKDKATIKYLSNIRDVKTGKISQPFTIAEKKYQMVRGISPNKEIVMGVFCHDELDESGSNIIHPVKYFEETIVKPIIQQESMGDDLEVKKTNNPIEKKQQPESLNLSEFKHYLVNEKNGKFRKFKNIVELAAAIMDENEKYMGIGEFKKFFESRVFGEKRNSETNLFEISTNGEESDEEMSLKAKKLMELIKKRIPTNVIATIKTPVAKREVIAAFAELIGVPRQGLPNLINGLKSLSSDISQTQTTTSNVPVSEKKVITKAELTESLLQPKVIKTIKVKDIK